ncbi:MAG: hypothetical protein V2I43_03950, partial [Parvularcula sp.]|nr:hypothetical protein [Parvularcula sp.]
MKRLAFLASLLLAACKGEVTPSYFADENPAQLSAWGAIEADGETLSLGRGVTPYALNAQLFTDYAHKLRTVWMPEGEARYGENGELLFPVGTVITKTFYYPQQSGHIVKANDISPVGAGRPLGLEEHRLIETRLLVHRQDGWHALSYVWNEEQTDAALKRTGAVVRLAFAGEEPFPYIVPNENQCKACHAPNATSAELRPLGPTIGQLHRPYPGMGDGESQLLTWVKEGRLAPLPFEPAAQADPSDETIPLGARARSYLAANCAHCHNPQGPADTSGLDLTLTASGPATGRCKPPIAAGSGTGGRRFGIEPG